jgi:ubiquinone/menaquinone biosynthesis C-methylase UbiE
MAQSQILLSTWLLAEQQPFSGWDFSYLDDKVINELPSWSYETMVRQQMADRARVQSALDLGTGGGEKLLEFKDTFPARMAATEGYLPNLQLARRRLAPYGVDVHHSEAALAEILPFGDAEFDLVIDRHSAYNTCDVERVLKPGGVFLTQQVDGKSLLDLFEAFDSQPHWPYFNLSFALERVAETHLVVEIAQEWTGKKTFKDVAALVYYLKAVPWIVDDFSVQTHLTYLERQQERFEREGHLVFHERLLVLRARKPKS